MQNLPYFATEQTLTLQVLIFDALRRNLSSELYSPYLWVSGKDFFLFRFSF